ncbi:MAG: Stk1 family PASTA domain-containing Ser/Thr kinase, partial [Nocardioidaceae bacterium]
MDTTAADPLVGTLLDGRYRVGTRIARGGMATVYQATDTRLERVVALKVLHRGYQDDQDFASRFVREARAAARLAHPHVVGVFDQGEDHGTAYLAMEYVPGHTLRDLIGEQGPLPAGHALALLEPVLSALSAAHDAGLVHRDVKPENVLLTDDGQVKVADFGLARAVSTGTNTSTSGVLIGTVSYLAPELVVDGSADARSDVYSAGVVLYEMLTGRKPHQGETPIQVAYKHVHEDVPAPSDVVAGIPAYLDALVARATARQRDARPADAKVLLRQLRRVRHALDRGVYDDPELTEDLLPSTSAGTSAWASDEDWPEPTTVVGYQQAALATDAGPESTGEVESDDPSQSHRGRNKRLVGWVSLLVVLVLAGGAAIAGWYYSVGRYMSTPDLTGMSFAQAEQQLRSSQLELSAVRAYSEQVPAGDIISTDPEAGERMLRDGHITAVVSKGKERYPMPAVLGLTEARATQAITNRHLAVGDVTRSYSAQTAEGLVMSSSQEKGERLRPGAEVDLVISKGRRPIDVPEVVGVHRTDARAALADVGLDPEVVAREYNDETPKGVVLSQNPADGTLYRGDSVELVVSQGPELVT